MGLGAAAGYGWSCGRRGSSKERVLIWSCSGLRGKFMAAQAASSSDYSGGFGENGHLLVKSHGRVIRVDLAYFVM